jgi:hypothetical protein
MKEFVGRKSQVILDEVKSLGIDVVVTNFECLPRCNMVHENFATTHTYIHYQDEQIHEHLFIPTTPGSVVLLVGNVTVINVANYSH